MAGRAAGLTQSRGAYVYRQHVPRDVRAVIGRTEFFRYIGAISKSAAETEARHLRLQFDDLIERARALSPDNRRDVIAIGGLERWEALHAGQTALIGAVVQSLSSGDVDESASDAEQAQQALHALRAHKLHKQLLGAGPRKRSAKSLQSIIDIWQQRARPKSQSTVARARLWLARLADHTGDKPLDQITTADVRAFRNALEQSPDYSRETARKGLSVLRTLFEHAVDVGLIDSNPVSGVRVYIPAPDSYAEALGDKGMTRTQVRAALDNAHKLSRDDLRWCLRMMLWHGLRCEEFANLRRADLINVDGIDCLMITDVDGRQIKTGSALRMVPLHPACKDFLAYASTIKTADLFEGPTPGHKARRMQRRLNPYLKSLGLPPLHSCRHTFRTACRNAGVPVDVSAAIMGHQLAGVHHEYGAAPNVKVLSHWVNRVDPLA